MNFPGKDKFRGCIIGQCLGDALGAPAEGLPGDICREYVRSRVGAWYRGEDEEIYRGQYTDDSQLARELMQSYVSCGQFDPEDYARRIAAIFEESRIVGRGLATEKAANKLIGGISWKEAGCPAPSAGNGSAMRAGPIGLFFFDNPRGMVQAARDQSWITHQDVRCLAGSVVIAGAVVLGLQAEVIDPDAYCRSLAEYANAFDADFADHIRKLPEWISLPPEKAVVPISSAGKPAGHVDGWPGISPFVIGSVLWSLYSFLCSPGDYRETIKTSIAVGGDVDTTAAMAGAVSGAYLGLDAIPRRLARRVHDNHTWGYDELIDLADRCHLITSGG